MIGNADLLKQYPLFTSSNQHIVIDEVSRYLWPHKMKLVSGECLHSQLFGIFFGDSALFNLYYGADVEIDTGDVADYYLIRSTLTGRGVITCDKERVSMRRGYLTISSPGKRNYVHINSDHRKLLLRVDRRAMESHLCRLLDRVIKEPLVFDMNPDSSSEGVRNVLYTMYYICEINRNKTNPMASALGNGLSDYLISMLLTQLPHNYSAYLHDECHCPLPYHVKKARDYIEQNLAEPITLSTLANIAGVSVRTLQNGFSCFMQQTPTEYIRSLRLSKVHDELLTAAAGENVTGILLRNGISSLGHFSQAYKKKYGCRPSDTLRVAVRS